MAVSTEVRHPTALGGSVGVSKRHVEKVAFYSNLKVGNEVGLEEIGRKSVLGRRNTARVKSRGERGLGEWKL